MSKPDDIPQDVWDATNGLVPGNVIAYTAESRRIWRAIVGRALLAERERAIEACRKQRASFASEQYATDQPLSSFKERFACDSCIDAIRKGDA